jgi:hypothetical protein
VQNLAQSRAIYATGTVVENPQSTALLEQRGLKPTPQQIQLKGVTEKVKIYEIPQDKNGWLSCAVSSWGGRCLSLADYVIGTGATRGATAAGAC